MALFRWNEDKKGKPKKKEATRLLVGQESYCRVCEARRKFSRCWRRISMLDTCPCCNLEFEEPRALYAKFQPLCPRCNEYLEQPDFDYGLCDGCGSKYELVEGAKPGLMPNKAQRAEMDRHGKSRSVE